MPLPFRSSPIQNNRLEVLKNASGPSNLPKPSSVGPLSPVTLKPKTEALPEVPQKHDSSIFGGKSEISRVELKQKLRIDPNVGQAARSVKLNMSPVERSKLVKEFSRAYGKNISKADIKQRTGRLSRKMFSEKDPEEHAKLRKEINFFKKIGGIK